MFVSVGEIRCMCDSCVCVCIKCGRGVPCVVLWSMLD